MIRRIYENPIPCTIVVLIFIAYAEVFYTLTVGSV